MELIIMAAYLVAFPVLMYLLLAVAFVATSGMVLIVGAVGFAAKLPILIRDGVYIGVTKLCNRYIIRHGGTLR